MRSTTWLMSLSLVSAVCFAACSDDDDDVASPMGGAPSVGEGGDGGTTTGGKTGGKAGSATAGSDAGGMGGAPPVAESACDVTDGQCIFRFDTFGDEQLWT